MENITNSTLNPIVDDQQLRVLKNPNKKMLNHTSENHMAFIKELLLPLTEINIKFDEEIIEPLCTFDTERQKLRHYFIYNDAGKQLLSAVAESNFCIRVGYGTVQHPVHQLQRLHPSNSTNDVMHLFRSASCDGCCFCSLQVIEVFAPTEILFGTVEQRFNIFRAVYSVKNTTGLEILRVEAHNIKQTMFKIFTIDKVEIGTIRRRLIASSEGESCVTEETLSLYFIASMPEDMKLLLLATTIFIDSITEAPNFLQNNE